MLGSVDFEPSVGTWSHRTCNGWNAQLRRDFMRLPESWLDNRDAAIATTVGCIENTLKSKLKQVTTALEGLTRYGSQTGGELTDKSTLLYDFWALKRALEGVQ